MKIKHLFGFALLLSVLCATTGWSQTPSKVETNATKQRTKKQTKRSANQRAESDTSVQDARYMRTSVSDGTATNNSNTTNYNSNNAVNNPTGVGSNPNTYVTPGNQPKNGTGSVKKRAKKSPPNQP